MERKEFTPKIKCFLCDGSHWARDYLKRKTLNAMIEEKEQEGETHMGSIQLPGVQVKKAKRKRVKGSELR